MQFHHSRTLSRAPLVGTVLSLSRKQHCHDDLMTELLGENARDALEETELFANKLTEGEQSLREGNEKITSSYSDAIDANKPVSHGSVKRVITRSGSLRRVHERMRSRSLDAARLRVPMLGNEHGVEIGNGKPDSALDCSRGDLSKSKSAVFKQNSSRKLNCELPLLASSTPEDEDNIPGSDEEKSHRSSRTWGDSFRNIVKSTFSIKSDDGDQPISPNNRRRSMKKRRSDPSNSHVKAYFEALACSSEESSLGDLSDSLSESFSSSSSADGQTTKTFEMIKSLLRPQQSRRALTVEADSDLVLDSTPHSLDNLAAPSGGEDDESVCSFGIEELADVGVEEKSMDKDLRQGTLSRAQPGSRVPRIRRRRHSHSDYDLVLSTDSNVEELNMSTRTNLSYHRRRRNPRPKNDGSLSIRSEHRSRSFSDRVSNAEGELDTSTRTNLTYRRTRTKLRSRSADLTSMAQAEVLACHPIDILSQPNSIDGDKKGAQDLTADTHTRLGSPSNRPRRRENLEYHCSDLKSKSAVPSRSELRKTKSCRRKVAGKSLQRSRSDPNLAIRSDSDNLSQNKPSLDTRSHGSFAENSGLPIRRINKGISDLHHVELNFDEMEVLEALCGPERPRRRGNRKV